ncbi:isopentenyldiphosphate isomerase [Marinilabilia salmonicolor]|uniref:NUDIX domain-containing protein n=1 Tax=Marinilabilia salmonicolor TaxID=989 RepID=UPI000D4BE284|nr:NUDIX domain-containing protein [Marinilabilia salmonicolor]PRY99965.1 isopentenyldiphosphate isomerase [Marinilabilia salmonicolor]
MRLSTSKPLSLAGKLLPGMLPLLIFVGVELVWGTTIGLVAALSLGLVQFVWFWFREHRLDKFILFDIGFLMVLGGLAILFDNALLFKLKPVFIGAALLLIIGYSAFSNVRLVMLMMQRYFKGLVAGPFESWLMQDVLRVFFWLLLAHTLLTFGAALWMPHAWWAAISGPGFYVLVGGLVLYSWLLNKKRKRNWSLEEWLPLVDEEGKVLGHAPRSLVHNGKNRWLHPVVHLQVVTREGLWLQKRPMHKTVQPGKWDTAVGGHVSKEETIETALLREAAEEIGVNSGEAVSLGRYLWRSGVENELVFVFALFYEGEIIPHPEELDGGKIWSFSELEVANGTGLLTPNFEEEYRRYGEVLRKMKER